MRGWELRRWGAGKVGGSGRWGGREGGWVGKVGGWDRVGLASRIDTEPSRRCAIFAIPISYVAESCLDIGID